VNEKPYIQYAGHNKNTTEMCYADAVKFKMAWLFLSFGVTK